MKQRGLSLGTVLIVVALLVTTALAVSGVSITHLNLMTRGSSAKQAENAARSVVNAAVAQVLSAPNHDFGESRTDSLDITINDVRARLTFDPNQATSWGISYSTNNLLNDRSAAGDGKAIPAAGLHLVGVAESGGVTRTVEALLHVPPFPYAIASSGIVEARNGLVVGSLPEVPQGTVQTPDELEPADLHSNFNGQAVVLGGGSRIGGDVKAVGTVSYPNDSSVQIFGEVLNNADTIDLPELQFQDYDPANTQGQFDRYDATNYQNLVVPGAARSAGDLIVNRGGLELDGGLLYVDGNLTVSGGIRGKGILAVTGEIVVDGYSSVSPDSSLAIICGRDFRLTGGGPDVSYLQGLVYTQGDFYADSVTLVGGLISRGAADLEDSRVFKNDLAGPITVSLGGQQTNGVTEIFEFNMSANVGGTRREFRTVFDLVAGENVTITISENGTQQMNQTLQTSYDTAKSDIEPELFQFASQDPLAGLLNSRLQAHLRNFILQWGNLRNDPGNSSSGPGDQISLDPSEFFSLEDRIRVALWLER